MSDLFLGIHHRRLNGHSATAPATAPATASATSTPDPMTAALKVNNGIIGNSTSGYHSSFNSSTMASADNQEIDENDEDDEEDPFENILSLKLRKPKHWKWELTTSRSCTNIALPRILLYDHRGELLADASNPEESVYRSPVSKDRTSDNTKRKSRKRSSKASTTNLTQSIRDALREEFNDLKIEDAQSPADQSPVRSSSYRSSPLALSVKTDITAASSCVDFFTNDLPDYQLHRRSSSLKGVRFKVDQKAPVQDIEIVSPDNSFTNVSPSINSSHIAGLPTPPSTTTTTATPTTGTSSNSSGPRSKRRYRRSHSSGRSPSILERFSYQKGRFSSPEYVEEHEVHHAPRYFLRTSKAGTLVVQEESFSRYRRRRKPKTSSSENVHNGSKSPSMKFLQKIETPTCGMHRRGHLIVPEYTVGGSLQNVTQMPETTGQHKFRPTIRRFRSDGNVLIQGDISTSEEEWAVGHEGASRENATRSCRARKFAPFSKQNKKDVVHLDAANAVRTASDSPTAR